MRTAIVTGDYFRPGQTFVNRHIRLLFGGDTCIIANGATGEDPYPDTPRLIRKAIPRTTVDRLTAPFTKARNRLVHGTSRIPVGAHRRALMGYLRDQKVELILGEFGTETLVIADLAAEMGLPCFTYFRGTDASASLRQPSRVHGYRRMFPKLRGIIAVSQFLLDNLAAHDLTHPNAHVIPSGVDVRRFTPGAKTPRSFVSVGRMIEKKHPELTLRAFAAGSRDAPDATLTFIGDGPRLDPCRALAADLGVADRVTFTGALPHDEVRDRLATTQTYLQHSVTAADGNTEGLPTAIQEALACGCLVISTRHAGIPEAIDHGTNGWLCDEWDEAGFTDLIARSLTADTAAMARAARTTAETRFDNDILLAKLEGVLQDGVRAG